MLGGNRGLPRSHSRLLTAAVAVSVAVAFARSPMTLAQTGFDLNAWSRGRFTLGLGSQVRAHVVRRFGMPWSKPAARMRSFVQALHAIWDSWETGEPLRYESEFYRHTLTSPMFTPEDRAAVDRSLEITDASAFRDRDFRSLSGGERQRVILASALAQEPDTLLLDEPATHLDLKHQLALYRLLARLGKTMLVVAVTHDLNLALQFSDRVLMMEDGRIAGDGAPAEVLTPVAIEAVFGVRAVIQPAPQGRVWMMYEG